MSFPVCHLLNDSQCSAHGTKGPALVASPNVLVNGLGALRREDTGGYPCDAAPKGAPPARVGPPTPPVGHEWHAIVGATTVYVNDQGLVGQTFATSHPHGPGEMVEGSPDVFVGGSTSSMLDESRADAQYLIDKALESLDRWNDDDRKRFREWFGDDSEQARQQMREHLLEMKKRLATVEIVDVSYDVYGQVYSADSSKLYVGRVFWKTHPMGEDSRAGTLVHEASHYRDTAGTADNVYGRGGARELARTNPNAARNNADSVEYFCETQVEP